MDDKFMKRYENYGRYISAINKSATLEGLIEQIPRCQECPFESMCFRECKEDECLLKKLNESLIEEIAEYESIVDEDSKLEGTNDRDQDDIERAVVHCDYVRHR